MLIESKGQRVLEYSCDLCIVGGGLTGMVAAIAAARRGTKVVLMQDRPVLGGNCSSEIRMWIRGAKGLHNRETGILSELEEENIYRNPRLNYSLWDTVLYGKVKAEKNITLLLNCSCLDAACENGTVKSVTGWQLTTYTFIRVKAKYFADCSGDSVLAPMIGAEYRIGRESESEYGEPIGGEVADTKTMGLSCLMQARDTGNPVKFTPPEWAYVYENDEEFDFTKRDNIKVIYGSDNDPKADKQVRSLTRVHTVETDGTNFWWLELGGEQDSIHDSEEIKDELIKTALGIWDHIKNRGDHGAETWALEWLAFVPGKRESRRYIGAHVLTQSDVESGGHFEDVIAYGGWPMDNHNPGGFKASPDQHASVLYPAPSPYGIPYRVLYSDKFTNLFFAGRNISATHAANSSARVMGTCALIGEAMGTAASMCVKYGVVPDEIYTSHMKELQDSLRDGGCYLPFSVREIPKLTRDAKINLTEEQKVLLFNGIERPDENFKKNYIELEKGETLTFSFDEEKDVESLRIMFDLDFSRESVSVNKKMRVFAQKCNEGLDFRPMTVAKTLVKSFEVYADGECVYSTDNYHNSRFELALNRKLTKLEIKFKETWGEDKIHLFSCDIK